jgi:hypothetical protein
MNIEQESIYNQVREAITRTDPPLGHLSENHVLRFCDSLQWVFTDILDYIVKAEQLRTQMDCNILREEEFTEILDMKAFNVTGSMDRSGRPIYILRIENFDPTKVSER